MRIEWFQANREVLSPPSDSIIRREPARLTYRKSVTIRDCLRRSDIPEATDPIASKAFYTALLGQEPYFDEPFYVGFNVGGFELGVWPDGDPAVGPVACWGCNRH